MRPFYHGQLILKNPPTITGDLVTLTRPEYNPVVAYRLGYTSGIP